jgi:hypothetical protein
MADCAWCAKFESMERMILAVENGADVSDVIGIPGVDFPVTTDGRETTIREAAHYVVYGGQDG